MAEFPSGGVVYEGGGYVWPPRRCSLSATLPTLTQSHTSLSIFIAFFSLSSPIPLIIRNLSPSMFL